MGVVHRLVHARHPEQEPRSALANLPRALLVAFFLFVFISTFWRPAESTPLVKRDLGLPKEMAFYEPIRWYSNNQILAVAYLMDEYELDPSRSQSRHALYLIDVDAQAVSKISDISTTAICIRPDRRTVLFDKSMQSDGAPYVWHVDSNRIEKASDSKKARIELMACASEHLPNVTYQNREQQDYMIPKEGGMFSDRILFLQYDVSFFRNAADIVAVVYDVMKSRVIAEFHVPDDIDHSDMRFMVKDAGNDSIIIAKILDNTSWRAMGTQSVFLVNPAGAVKRYAIPWNENFADGGIDVALVNGRVVLQHAPKYLSWAGALWVIEDDKPIRIHDGPLRAGSMTVSPNGRRLALLEVFQPSIPGIRTTGMKRGRPMVLDFAEGPN